jgi:hypothetical protein
MSQDMRKYAKQTKIQLIVGGIILFFVVGLGLIAVIYGLQAALLGLICLLGAFLPIGAIAILLGGLDLFVKRLNK